MSLQLRLNLATGFLATLIVSALVGAVLLDAQPRMRAENNSMMRLTQSVIRSSLAPLLRSDDPLPGLRHLVEELASLRHVTVQLERPSPPPEPARPEQESSDILNPTPPGTVRIPIIKDGVSLGTVRISPQPADELDELWQSADKIIEYGAALILAMFVLNSLVIKWSLSPVTALKASIAKMEQGQYAAVVPETGTPELGSIGKSLNRLAGTLNKAREENQSLTRQIIGIQEDERKSLARDLHDEIGANLFVLRTKAALLCKKLDDPARNLDRIETMAKEVVDEIERLQQTNRRILQSLTPPALMELGLKGALEALVAMWRKHRPSIELTCTLSGNTHRLDDTLKITVYRIVQEALTNAYRHAGAAMIDAAIDISEPDSASAGSVTIRVSDNGSGILRESSEGFGINSMRNRARALAGTFEIRSVPACGVTITAALPVTSASNSHFC